MFKNLVIIALVSATVIAGTTVWIFSATEWSSETNVHIAARRLDDGSVEFGLRHQLADGYSDITLPDLNKLPANAPVGEWHTSSDVAVPSSHVYVQLREGVYAGDYQDEFEVIIDGQVYRTNCSDLRIDIVSQTVLFETRDEDCSRWIGLATVCGIGEDDCDDQRAMVYLWERAQRREYGFEDIEVSLDEATEIAAAVFRDYMGPNAVPPTVASRTRSTTSSYSSADHTIYLTEWGRDLDTVFHETVHAIIRVGRVGGGHDEHYAAQILDVWGRYVPLIDADAARQAAAEYGVEVAAEAPVSATSDDAVELVHDLICTNPVRSESFCSALDGVMRVPSQPPSMAGDFQPVMQHGSIDSESRYETGLFENGTVWSRVRRVSSAEEVPVLSTRLHLQCTDEITVAVWWESKRAISNSVQWRIGDEEFTRETWGKGNGAWTIGGDRREYWIVYAPNAEEILKEMVFASSGGETFTVRIRSGADTYTTTFNLDGLFETPIQPNLTRCGQY